MICQQLTGFRRPSVKICRCSTNSSCQDHSFLGPVSQIN